MEPKKRGIWLIAILAAAIAIGLLTTPEAWAMAPTSLVDNGQSTSSTPGTLIAQLDAGAGQQLVHVGGFATHGSSLNTQIRLIITYTDATTATVDTSAPTSTTAIITNGGVARTDSSIPTLLDESKKIQRVRVETLGSGSGQRTAALAGTAIPIAGWPDVHDSLILQTPEPQGVNCPTSGTRITSGRDDGMPTGIPNNGELEGGEIDHTSFACTGPAGPQGPAGPEGPVATNITIANQSKFSEDLPTFTLVTVLVWLVVVTVSRFVREPIIRLAIGIVGFAVILFFVDDPDWMATLFVGQTALSLWDMALWLDILPTKR